MTWKFLKPSFRAGLVAELHQFLQMPRHLPSDRLARLPDGPPPGGILRLDQHAADFAVGHLLAVDHGAEDVERVFDEVRLGKDFLQQLRIELLRQIVAIEDLDLARAAADRPADARGRPSAGRTPPDRPRAGRAASPTPPSCGSFRPCRRGWPPSRRGPPRFPTAAPASRAAGSLPAPADRCRRPRRRLPNRQCPRRSRQRRRKDNVKTTRERPFSPENGMHKGSSLSDFALGEQQSPPVPVVPAGPRRSCPSGHVALRLNP